MSENTILELVKALAWPFIAALMLIAFYSPISSTLLALAHRADQIQTLKLGAIELSIKVSDLPKPPQQVADALPAMDNHMIIKLLWAAERFGVCYRPSIPYSVAEEAAFDKLAKLGQVKLEKGGTQAGCDEYFSGTVMEAGRDTKSFLLSFISAQFRDAKRS